MLVCIVTLHRARNCGAYMQSYALAEKIKQLGHEVVYLSPTTIRKRHYAKQFVKSLLGPVCRLSPAQLWLNLRFNYRLFQDQRRFREVNSIGNIDCFVLGSDIIWQMRNAPTSENMDRFFGLDFPENKLFPYAPSANGTALDVFLKDERIVPALNRMRALSVRDKSTLETIRALTGQDAQLVCDPVLLHEADFYRAQQQPCRHKDFILVYAFGMQDFSDERIREIQSYAKARGKKLISFGLIRKWCDLSVPYYSMAMSAYFDRADCVITNTFHGTIFSLLFGKRFIQLASSKAKVTDLLSHFGLESHILAPGGSIAAILDQEIDQNDLKKRIEDLRADSIAFLERNLY